MSGGNGFTPTEQRIMDVLKDWKPHTSAQLCAAIDEMADNHLLNTHLYSIRGKLMLKGLYVASIGRMPTYFQLCSLSPPGYEE